MDENGPVVGDLPYSPFKNAAFPIALLDFQR